MAVPDDLNGKHDIFNAFELHSSPSLVLYNKAAKLLMEIKAKKNLCKVKLTFL